MPYYEREDSPGLEGPDKDPELAWLEENLTIFWPAAHYGYEQEGRGALVFDASVEPLGEESQFNYAPQSVIEESEDEASRRLAAFVAEYDPEKQFIAAVIKPELELATYQIEVGEDLVEAVNAYEDVDYRPRRSTTETEPKVTLEPPDLETLIAWEAEGGCEAACPHNCWVECDGTCPHGNPSWLLKLGLI